MTVHGHVDMAQNGKIMGWAWDDGAPGLDLEILARADDKTISSCRANVFRQDLADAGIGDGRHGFCLAVPDLAQRHNVISVIDAASGIELEGSPIDRRQESEIIHNEERPNLLFDVTDLLMFLDTHRKLTGIPRVQIEILRAIFADCLYDLARIHFVAISNATHVFEEVDKNSLLNFIDKFKYENSGNVMQPDGLLHIDHIVKFGKFDPDAQFCANSILLSLGACWGLPDFFILLNQLRHKGMKFVPLVHDIIPLMAPSLCPPEMSDIFHQFIRKIFGSASMVLAVSDSCASDISRFAAAHNYDIPLIKVIKNGGNTVFTKGRQQIFLKRYVLVVSTIEARKNHIALARAWEKLFARYEEAIPDLVFVGSQGWNIKELQDFLKATNFLHGHIKILDNVTDGELADLYQNCLFTAYPSLYEGWGLPVSESLYFGKTCLCSSASALPEAGLDFCLYFNPCDIDDLTAEAERLIFDEALREKLERRIQKEYRPGTWSAAAASIVAAALEAGSRPGTDICDLPESMECAFWQPPLFLEENTPRLRDIMAFGRGYLSDARLGWENYVIGDSLFVSGRLYPRDRRGLWGDPEGNTISFRLASDTAIINLLLEVAEGPFPQEIEFCHGPQCVESAVFLRPCQIFRLSAENFSSEGVAHIFVRHMENKPVCFRAMLILARDDLQGRMTVLERMQTETFMVDHDSAYVGNIA